ncbi:DUF4245 domain-containing protein [Microlunatus soli]|uniref:DUF4245 domain-containing protein n=1 Tax=Microlunatus soli TaxID=630515 RepID=UPI0012F743AE|nr:DUF4245 domain-containing protein [Microlunatus soli]
MARARRSPTARDMVLSLLVIMIPVAIFAALLTSGPDKPTVQTVDWQSVASRAREQAPYEVLAPAAIPAGWRATRASWTEVGQPDPTGQESVRNRWQLGVLTDRNIYLELDQVDKQPAEFVEQATREAVDDGVSRVDGNEWKRLVTDDDRTRALVHAGAGVTTVVTGDASYQQLEAFVGLLRTDQ